MSPADPTRRAISVLAAAAALLGTAAWLQPATSGADLWWHLASGRQIWELGGPPATDSFSFTFAGRQWLNHEWLWDAVVWRLYTLDPQWVAGFNLALLLGVFAISWETARRATRSLLASGIAVVAVAATCHWFLDIRPHVITLLFTSGVILTRDHPRAGWLWPIGIAIWANLHGGFVFGIGLIGLLVLVRTIASRAATGKWSAHPLDWVSLGLCLIVWLANPWGAGILDYPLQYLNSGSPFREIVEWHPPTFSLDPRYYAGRFALLAAVAAAGVPLALRRAPLAAAVCAVTFAMALTSRRFIPLFAISAVLPVALFLAWLQERVRGQWSALRTPRAGLATAATGALVGAALAFQVTFAPNLLERWTTSDLFPREAARYLDAIGPPQRILNDYEWGGYLMLHVPQSRVFVDGRANTLYDDDIFLQQRALRHGAPDSAAILERYPADAAFVPFGSPAAQTLMHLPDPWVSIYEDTLAVILLPPSSPLLGAPLPSPEQVLGTGWQSYYPRFKRALLSGDRAAAIRELETVVEGDPLRVGAYGQLSLLHALSGDPDAIRRTMAAGRRAVPRRAAELAIAEGRAYSTAGDLDQALAAFRRSFQWGPYQSIRAARARVEAAEAALSARGVPTALLNP